MKEFLKQNALSPQEIESLYQSNNLKLQLQGHTGCVTALFVNKCYTPNTPVLYSGSDDKSIKVWDLNNFTLQHTIKCNNWINAFQIHENILFAAGADKCITVYDIKNQNDSIREINKLFGHQDYINVLLVVNNQLYSASSDGCVIIWDTRILKPLFILHNAQVGDLFSLAVIMDNSDDKGPRLFCAGSDKFIQVYYENALQMIQPSGEILKPIKTTVDVQQDSIATLKGHTGWIKSLLSTGTCLISGSYDKTIRIWSLRTYLPLTVLSGHTGYIQTMLIATVHDEILLFSGSFDKTVKVWNITNITATVAVNDDNNNNNNTDTRDFDLNTTLNQQQCLLKATYTGYTDFIHSLAITTTTNTDEMEASPLLIAGAGDALYIRSLA